MSDQIPVSAQAAAVREMLREDNSKRTFAQKLEAIEERFPDYADGVAKVREEGEKPRRAGSGSAPHEPLGLADCI